MAGCVFRHPQSSDGPFIIFYDKINVIFSGKKLERVGGGGFGCLFFYSKREL